MGLHRIECFIVIEPFAQRARLRERDARIRLERRAGRSVGELAERYYLSEKSIQRILRDNPPSESDMDKEGIQ